MRYVGWYPRRRGILEHLERGSVSLLDCAIHDFLCLIADHRTGVAWSSAEKIHALAGSGISLRAIQRSLAHMEEIRWIKRFMIRGRKGNYPTLIGRYFVRDASLKWWSVNLDRTTDWRDVQFDPVTDPSFVGHQSLIGGVTESGSDASPIQEGREKDAKTEEVRSSETDRENVRVCDGASAFEDFDLPKNRKLTLSESLTKTLSIDEDRLREYELKALRKLDGAWRRSFEDILAGQIVLADWIETAIDNLRRSRLNYPQILNRRMHELRDGRLTVA